jgi:hypothetical protein
VIIILQTTCTRTHRATSAGFIRLALGDPQLYSYIKAAISSSVQAVDELVNNFTAGAIKAEFTLN